jgi:phosphosulfolactate synthase
MLTFDHPRDNRKERKGRTIVIDVGPDTFGWTGRQGLADLLEVAGSYMDYGKIWAMNALTLPETFVRDVVAMYKAAGVKPFAGGLLFEYAYLKNDIDGLIERLLHLDLPGLEISENYLTLQMDERLRQIERFTRAGIAIVFEYGRKKPDAPMAPEDLAAVVDKVMACGAHHVVFEQSEFDLLDEVDSAAVDQMVGETWFENVFIEADPFRFPKQHADLIQRFGPDINLANITPGQLVRIENFRRGLGRTIDFPLIRDMVEGPG